MENTEHTKGEWVVVSQMPNGYTIEAEKGKVVAFIQEDENENSDLDTQITDKEAYANAKLICQAPKLLKALKELYDAIDSCVELTPELLRNVQQVIDKATK